MFGAVKLEDLEKVTESSDDAPKMGAVKMGEAPKFGEQKPEAKPAEVFVPKMPSEKKKEEAEEDKGLDATSFRMDMMVEADEDIAAAGGIFSGAAPVKEGVTPIRSAIFQQDDVNFKGKTATHAESVFDTDQAIKEEQEEKKEAEEDKAEAEAGAKRAEKAWGVGTGDAAAQAAEAAEEKAAKMNEGKQKEEEKKADKLTEEEAVTQVTRDADITAGRRKSVVKIPKFLKGKEKSEGDTKAFVGAGVATAEELEKSPEAPAESVVKTDKKAEATVESELESDAPVGIFTTKPAKGSFFNKVFGNIQATFNKPIGKKKS